MRSSRLILPLAVGTIAACGVSPAAGAASSPRPDRTIELAANDQLRFTPDAVTVRTGETVAFVVTNTGTVQHEFLLGDAGMQQQHDQEMAHGGQSMSMGHGTSEAMSIPPGKTVTLVHTFGQAGSVLYGCHVPGHYASGMRGTVTVTGR